MYNPIRPLFQATNWLTVVIRDLRFAKSKLQILHTSLLNSEWTLRESNPRPPACKAGALPTELKARKRLCDARVIFACA